MNLKNEATSGRRPEDIHDPQPPRDAPRDKSKATSPESTIPSVERRPGATGGGLEGTVPAAERSAEQNQM